MGSLCGAMKVAEGIVTLLPNNRFIQNGQVNQHPLQTKSDDTAQDKLRRNIPYNPT